MRSSGLPTVGILQSGTHVVHFYRHTRQLLETHAAFCVAGLTSNELCLWIITPPYLQALAELELTALSVDVKTCLVKGQLEFVPHSVWYFDAEAFNLQGTVDRSNALIERAKAGGFAGIRICGDLRWLKTDRDWKAFLSYEHAIHQALIGTEVIALCSYPIRTERDCEVTELMQCHHAVLRPSDQSWEYLPTAV